jgi:hypothetical protein
MDLGQPIIPDAEAPALTEPGEGSLGDPAVAPEVLTALDAPPRDAGHDAARPTGVAGRPRVIGFVGMELRRASAGPAQRPANRRDRIQQGGHGEHVGGVGGAQAQTQRDALALDQDVVLGARLAAVRGVRPCDLAPLVSWSAVCGSLQARQAAPP